MRGIEVPHEIGIDQRTHEGSGAEDELRERRVECKVLLPSGHTQQGIDRNLQYSHPRPDHKERSHGH